MSTGAWLGICAVLLLAGVGGIYLTRRADRWSWQRQEDRHASDLFDLLMETRNGAVRYEIEVTDWGAEHGEMRWRWTIWDADRVLRQAIVVAKDLPGQDEEGVLRPYMLGNAPTRPLAEAEALAWMATENAPSAVIRADH